MKIDRMGVLVLMAHLVITLFILALYGFFTYIDKPVTSVENMLLIILGYWFGAIGKEAIRPSKQDVNNETSTQDVNK